MTRTVPEFIVEYFLQGRTRKDAVEQFLQDGGIVTDVWLEFAKDVDQPVRVLVAPVGGVSAIDVGYELHQQLKTYRRHRSTPSRSNATNVSPLENYVAATVYFDELVRVLLPLTRFYAQKQLAAIHRKMAEYSFPLARHLKREIKSRLGDEAATRESLSDQSRLGDETAMRDGHSEPSQRERVHWRVIEAAPVAALLGVFALARKGQLGLPRKPQTIDPRQPGQAGAFNKWVRDHAERIAQAATVELNARERVFPATAPVSDDCADKGGTSSRIFLDRKAMPAHREAICTVKADAAQLLFEVSCTNISWAIVDSGIAATHPAFKDHSARGGSRVQGTYDFTLIDQIRNFDITDHATGTAAFKKAVGPIVNALVQLQPDHRNSPAWRSKAETQLGHVADQLRLKLRPNWGLIDELISLQPDDGSSLVSDHGTHVAGILGADRRRDGPVQDGEKDRIELKGICPDIKLYDLRVIAANRQQGDDLRATESAIVAALEFVQYLNRRSMSDSPLIHGVNISLQIPHEVRNYGCGATPICIACDRLVGSGVVVVAAAGNRGWNEQEIGFGNFVFCSITDPGNARDVITVGSTHRLKPHIYGVSYFSSRGPTGDGRIKPDLVAPGENIRGPIRGGLDRELSGTSQAAPLVSGAAAMLLARRPELIGRALDVKEVICSSSTDLGRERYFQGHGLLDVLRALQFE